MISWVYSGTPAESPANRRRWISPQLGTSCDKTCSSNASGCRDRMWLDGTVSDTYWTRSSTQLIYVSTRYELFSVSMHAYGQMTVQSTSSFHLMKSKAHECIDFKHNIHSKHRSASADTPTLRAHTHRGEMTSIRQQQTHMQDWSWIQLWTHTELLTWISTLSISDWKSEKNGIIACHTTSWRKTSSNWLTFH